MTEFCIAEVQEAIASAYPERDAILQGTTRVTAATLTDRSRRLAHVLAEHGLGAHRERQDLAAYESGQDHAALLLHDGPEYLETMIGAYKARAVPFNVNHRYVATELHHVLDMADTRAVIYHGTFAPVLAEVLPNLPGVELLIRVGDGTEHPLLPGALDYEACLDGASPDIDRAWSPDDLYLLLTGGTTGYPKGVLWRQADVIVAGMGVSDVRNGRDWSSIDEVVAAAAERSPRVMVAPPLMHGAGQWMAFQAILGGGAVVLPSIPHRREPADILQQMELHAAETLILVGDAFARPLIEELRRTKYDLHAMRRIASGGAILTPESKAALIELLPDVTIFDSMGASETGGQARARTSNTTQLPPGRFQPNPGTVIVDEGRTRVVAVGDESMGWVGQTGRIPLGYLGDPIKTASTFPMIDGQRTAVPGDRAHHVDGGLIQLLGRDSVTINSGGEKIFAEEVEAAILTHPTVLDVTVVGRPSERWGSEVVAVVALRPGTTATAQEIRHSASEQLAAYKLPKQFVFVDEVHRSPAGKADYRWAAEIATSAPI